MARQADIATTRAYEALATLGLQTFGQLGDRMADLVAGIGDDAPAGIVAIRDAAEALRAAADAFAVLGCFTRGG